MEKQIIFFEEIFLRLGLPLIWVSAISGKKAADAKLFLKGNPKILYTYYYVRELNLSVKEACWKMKILRLSNHLNSLLKYMKLENYEEKMSNKCTAFEQLLCISPG